jgi:hypothetical protein
MPSDLRNESPDGLTVTLPHSATVRWTAWRKTQVITAIRVSAITFSEACERYCLSLEELSAWEAAFDEDGLAALQMNYRSARAGRAPRPPSESRPMSIERRAGAP